MKRVTLSSAKKKAWKQFSMYIRLKNADINGNVKCITCGKIINWKQAQAGHLIPGRHNAVLFQEDGVHVQCFQCNCMKGGNWPAYYEYMKKMYGVEIIESLIKESHEVVKYSISDLQELEKHYKRLVESL